MRNLQRRNPRGSHRRSNPRTLAQEQEIGRNRRHRRHSETKWQEPPLHLRGRQLQQSHRQGGWNRNRRHEGRINNHPRLGRIENRPNRPNRRHNRMGFPSADYREFDDRYEVLIEIPGVLQSDINVSVTNHRLIIKGTKQKNQTDETVTTYKSELYHGRFNRVFNLPPHIENDGISAELKDGLLSVVLPKSEADKPTEISINVDA